MKIKEYTDHLDYLVVAHTQPLNLAGKIDFTGDDMYTGWARKLGLIKNTNEANHPQVIDLGHIHHELHAACAFYNSGFDDAAAHEAGPHAVGDDLCKAFILRRSDHRGEHVTRILRVFGQFGGVLVAELGEGPLRLHLGAGLQRDLNQGLATTGVDLVHRHAAGLRHFDFLRAEHGGEFEEVLL